MNRAEVIKKRIYEAPDTCQNIMAKAYEGSSSPRQAIKAFCLHCTGYKRDTITNCEGYSCPLWKFRPFQQAGEAE